MDDYRFLIELYSPRGETLGQAPIDVDFEPAREWAVFCDKVLEKPELKNDERFSSNTRRSDAREELRKIIVDTFFGMTGEQVVARLDEAKIGNSSESQTRGNLRFARKTVGV